LKFLVNQAIKQNQRVYKKIFLHIDESIKAIKEKNDKGIKKQAKFFSRKFFRKPGFFNPYDSEDDKRKAFLEEITTSWKKGETNHKQVLWLMDFKKHLTESKEKDKLLIKQSFGKMKGKNMREIKEIASNLKQED